MIVGIGCDLVHVPRVARLLQRWDQRFLDRVFSPAEQAYCRRFLDPAPSFAARFAAKEAFYKAISRGNTLSLWFRDAEVVHEVGRVLRLELSPRAQELASAAGVSRTHLTLTHDGEYAGAYVVLEAG
jgi:holo-[acyl-carrier protein] synthase